MHIINTATNGSLSPGKPSKRFQVISKILFYIEYIYIYIYMYLSEEFIFQKMKFFLPPPSIFQLHHGLASVRVCAEKEMRQRERERERERFGDRGREGRERRGERRGSVPCAVGTPIKLCCSPGVSVCVCVFVPACRVEPSPPTIRITIQTLLTYQPGC